ncbi:uncharacterized protein M6D78_009148 [Vipera latastei]
MAKTSILKKTLKQTEPLEDLSATNKSLRLQVEELRGTLACLDAENQMFLKDKECIKGQQKSLRDTVNDLKSTIEHLQKTVEDIREKLDQANMAIQELALQNKSLVKANEDLNEEMHEATSQVAVFKDDKPGQEDDLEEMRNLPSEVQKYLRNLEDKLAKMEHSFHVEKIHSSQLKEKVTDLQKVREDRRKRIKDLQNQQAAKILMMLLFGCCLFLGLVLAYTHIFNPLFISHSLLVLLSDQSIDRLVRRFSPYLEWRNDGLLPF